MLDADFRAHRQGRESDVWNADKRLRVIVRQEFQLKTGLPIGGKLSIFIESRDCERYLGLPRSCYGGKAVSRIGCDISLTPCHHQLHDTGGQDHRSWHDAECTPQSFHGDHGAPITSTDTNLRCPKTAMVHSNIRFIW